MLDAVQLTGAVPTPGAPTVTVRVATGAPDAVLFGKLYDVTPGGRSTLPASLAAPVRVPGSPDGTAVTLRLPAVDHDFAAGHRMRLVLATTDLGYASPAAPATMTVSLVSPELTVPLDTAIGDDAGI